MARKGERMMLGVWVVYGWSDLIPYPLYLAKDEVDADKYIEDVNKIDRQAQATKKFWKFGDEFGTE